jgi:hypothetical protein
MWPLLFCALWSLLLLGVWLSLPRLLAQRQRTAARAGIAIVSIALIARLVPNFILPEGAAYDVESYRIVADLLLHGQEVYGNTAGLNRHPYLPFQMYWLALARWGAAAMHLPFVQVVRLAPIGADVVISLLLYLSLRRSHPATAFYGGLSYALNPISVFVSAYHGQFDAIPMLFTLLSLYWLDRSPLSAGSWLGLGILNKSWPVLALPSLVAATRGWRRKLIFLGASIFIPLLGVGVYAAVSGVNVSTVLKPALGYNWGIGIWGYTYLVRLFTIFRPDAAPLLNWFVKYGRHLTLAALGLVWLLRARKEPPAASILTVLVTFFALTHAFSIQYLVWLVPFAILDRDSRWLTRYTLAAFSYMFLVYTTLIFTTTITRLLPMPQADWFVIMPAGLPVWLVATGWVWDRLWGKRAQAGTAQNLQDHTLMRAS